MTRMNIRASRSTSQIVKKDVDVQAASASDIANAFASAGVKSLRANQKIKHPTGHAALKMIAMTKHNAANLEQMAAHTEGVADRAGVHAHRHAGEASGRIHAAAKKSPAHLAAEVTRTHGSAMGAIEALKEGLDGVTDLTARESHKLAKNITRITADLEDAGLMDAGSFIENAKNGAIWFKGYYINLGSLLASLILMKSMKYVVKVGEDEETKSFSVDGLTDWLKGKGTDSFNANPTITAAAGVDSALSIATTNVFIQNKTLVEVAARVKTLPELVDTRYYNCLIADLDKSHTGSVAQSMMLLSGAEIKNTLRYVVVPAAAYVTNGLGVNVPFASMSDTLVSGIRNVLMVDGLSLTTEKMRISGALDLAGAVKTAGFVAVAGWNRIAGLIYPFVTNTLGNLITDSKLNDFIGKE